VLEEYPLPVCCCACVAKGSARRESRKKAMEAGFEGAMCAERVQRAARHTRAHSPENGPRKGPSRVCRPGEGVRLGTPTGGTLPVRRVGCRPTHDNRRYRMRSPSLSEKRNVYGQHVL
jgi:hypothetical protein